MKTPPIKNEWLDTFLICIVLFGFLSIVTYLFTYQG